MVRRLAPALVGALLLSGFWASSGTAQSPPVDTSDQLDVYTGVVDQAGLRAIVELGVDRHELEVTAVPGEGQSASVEVVLTGQQAEALAGRGIDLAPKASGAARRASALQAGVFRMYSGEGGIQEELVAQAAAHPGIAELHVIGQTVQGRDITAVRVTADPGRVRPGKRPTTVYLGAQHAREWITPEMVRRLLAHFLDGYGSDARITDIVDNNELWFIPVGNPDGYDFSFEPGQRLQRKNMRDNNGDGVFNAGEGVDLNRNLPTRWGYDNEGSSPNPSSETYRGPAPGSEPETQALDGLFRRITPEFFINYHSAAELLLYGLGWQVATPSPDDVIYEAMAGDDANSAIPGYDPDISAELYTTNGDTDTHMQARYGTLGFTPEMSTCETASARDPDDAYEPEGCESVFHFPDDEALIQAEFENNIAFALAVAESAQDPDDPVSVVGRDTPNFVLDTFMVSYGDPQEIAVTVKRAVRAVTMQFRINGGRTMRVATHEWRGGERYGFENTDYYHERRATLRGASPGDQVEVWFRGIDKDARGSDRAVESEHFTYTVAHDTGNDVLVIANEDYTGVNPEPAPNTFDAPKYLDEHLDALAANGIAADVWDVDAQGIPHDLGVLDHYDVVLWYLGDNRLTQDPEDLATELPIVAPGFAFPDSSVAERQQYLTIAVRDFLNAGGKLIHAGETTAYEGALNDALGGAIGGIYYGLDGAPDQQCVVEFDFFSDCLLLADDFVQYYLGAFERGPRVAEGIEGTAGPALGDSALFGGPATVDNPIDELGGFRLTSTLLPPDQFPQFSSSAFLQYLNVDGTIEAIEGELAAVAEHADEHYMRLGRTFDLTGVSATDAPRFEAQLAFSAEQDYDFVIVEAHTVNEQNWTTLPDLGDGTVTDMPADCDQGFLLDLHPHLLRYILPSEGGGDPCDPAAPGIWNMFTGESDGWQQVAFDLSAYAGQQVEIVVSYVADPAFGGNGAILDDTRLVTNSGVSQAEGFEAGLGAWSVLGPPEGSFNVLDWEVADRLGRITAGVATEDTVLLGFGIEQLDSPQARAELIADSLELIM
jgi:hypothetical protein